MPPPALSPPTEIPGRIPTETSTSDGFCILQYSNPASKSADTPQREGNTTSARRGSAWWRRGGEGCGRQVQGREDASSSGPRAASLRWAVAIYGATERWEGQAPLPAQTACYRYSIDNIPPARNTTGRSSDKSEGRRRRSSFAASTSAARPPDGVLWKPCLRQIIACGHVHN